MSPAARQRLATRRRLAASRAGLLACALIAALVAGRAGAATDPGAAGPLLPGLRSASIPGTQGATLQADVHFPSDASGNVDAAASPCPVVVFGHGFSRTRARYVDFGRHLASRGFITIIPNFPGLADHSRNADDLSACVSWALAAHEDPASWLFGHVDARAIGSSGHSAGGMSALVALSRDPRIVAAAPMDPVDSGGLGAAALATVTRPVAITHSEDSSCNASGSSRALYAAAGPPRRRVLVVSANHCDPEMPSDVLCGLTCGNAAAARQALYRKVVTGWLEMYLRCDPTYEPWVSGAQMQADVAAGLVEYEADPDPPPPPCQEPPGEVTGLRLVKFAADARLSWDPVTADPPVLDYRVLRSADAPFTSPSPERATPLTSLDDPGVLTDGAAWFYLVRAANAAGTGP